MEQRPSLCLPKCCCASVRLYRPCVVTGRINGSSGAGLGTTLRSSREDCLCKRSFARIACLRCPISCPGLLFSYFARSGQALAHCLLLLWPPATPVTPHSGQSGQPFRRLAPPEGPSCDAAKYCGNLSTVDPSCLLPSRPSYKRPACLLPCRHEPRWRS
jgi:hypothetical protein